MNISPRTYRPYSVAGVNVFPLIATNGSYEAAFISYLFKGTPEVLNGGNLGLSEEVQSDDGGHWIAIKFTCNDSDEDISRKVEQAEQKLDSKL